MNAKVVDSITDIVLMTGDEDDSRRDCILE